MAPHRRQRFMTIVPEEGLPDKRARVIVCAKEAMF